MRYFFQIANLAICIETDEELELWHGLLHFHKENVQGIDLHYTVKPLTDILKKKAENACLRREFRLLETEGKTARAYFVNWQGKRDYVVQSAGNEEGQYTLFVPQTEKENAPLFSGLNILDYMGLEEGLLCYEAFLLHSSFVVWEGCGILFTAASGTGKSTQASLWEEYLDASVCNGDRTIIRRIEGGFYGFGSPFAGTSGIFKNESAPIKAIVVLSQSTENQIRILDKRTAFIALYRETLMNTWNQDYMSKMTDLILDVCNEIPVYHLACRPDREAVELTRQTVFGEYT